ncbi:MAG: RluA family pseudouridine synthase [Polyangiaceae bacterium]|nr:RluA family pseudouridine synthase [Polyangiaceae bacterium]
MDSGKRSLLGTRTPNELDAEEFQFEVAEQDGALRLDRLIADKLPQLSRRKAAQMLEAGVILVDQKPARKSQLSTPGSLITILDLSWGAALADPELELDIIFQNNDFVAVNKPAGLPSAALVGKSQGNCASALLAQFPEMRDVGFGPQEPGLIHRLDTETSGILLAAKNQQTFHTLRQLFSDARAKKTYLAWSDRRLPGTRGRIALTLEARGRGPVRPNAGKHAHITSYRAVTPALTGTLDEREGPDQIRSLHLIEATVYQAFRHQVRAHLAHLGAPLLGDLLYGGTPWPQNQEREHPRHALHAHEVIFESSPWGPLHLKAELPQELQLLLSS